MLLGSRRIIAVKGEGIQEFLQGLVTQDMNIVKPGTAKAAVFLNAKGRVMTDALLYRPEKDQGLLVDVPAAHVDALANHLVRHKLRLPISIEKNPNLGIQIVDSKDGFEDPRLATLGHRVIMEREMKDSIESTEYRRRRFLQGVVEAQDLGNDSIPIFYNFDFLNAIAFAKGCYSGQELVTRTLRRGVVRKRAVPVQTLSEENSIKVGSPVLCNGKEIGSVFASEGNVGLALLQFESAVNERAAFCSAVAQFAREQIAVGDQKAKIPTPGYCLV